MLDEGAWKIAQLKRAVLPAPTFSPNFIPDRRPLAVPLFIEGQTKITKAANEYLKFIPEPAPVTAKSSLKTLPINTPSATHEHR